MNAPGTGSDFSSEGVFLIPIYINTFFATLKTSSGIHEMYLWEFDSQRWKCG